MAPSPRSPSSPSGGGWSSAVAEIPGIELSFDGGPGLSDDSVHPLRNTASEGTDSKPFDPSGPKLVFSLVDSAVRTSETAGKYGRGIELDTSDGTDDFIRVTGIYPGFDAPELYAWWQLDGGGGIFWWEECRFEVGLDASHQIYVEVFDDDCLTTTRTTSTLTWPDFSGWHHLLVHRYTVTTATGASAQRFALRIDFGASEEVLETASLSSLQGTPSEVRFGEGIDGRVDEFLAAEYPPGPEADFDFDPTDCGPNPPQGVTCFEEQTTASGDHLADDITWDLPVRYKVVYDQGVCTSEDKCRVVFALSGGGSCSDNYARAGDGLIHKLVAPPPGGTPLAVVTVDPICWTPGFEGYPDEITQVLAAKAALASEEYLDLSGEYYATGCSHGAQKVVEWVVQDEAHPTGDRPKRVFARSGGQIGEHVDCVYHESWCGEKQKLWDEFHFQYSPEICTPPIDNPWDHDHEILCIDNYISDPEQEAFIDKAGNIDEELLLNREIGLSWGENITGDVCTINTQDPDAPSQIACPEEGGLAATDSGRQLRDAWKAAEIQYLPAGTRTGFFIENDTADCRHCGLTDIQMNCVVSFLEGGRSALSTDPCLLLNEGDPAADCTDYPL